MSKNFANREVCNAIFRDYASKKPVLYVDYANTTTTEVTGESVSAYGGWGHPKRVIFNGERGGTIAFEFQVHPFQLFALMSGAEVEKEASFYKREVVEADAEGTIHIKAQPVDGKSMNIFAYEDDCGEDLNANGVATVGSNVAPEGESPKFPITGVTVTKGSKYAVYYKTSVAGDGVQKISITGKTFPKALIVDADTIYKAEDDSLIPMVLHAYKCQPQSQFTLTHSNTGDPGTITLTCDLMEDGNGDMLDLIAIEE